MITLAYNLIKSGVCRNCRGHVVKADSGYKCMQCNFVYLLDHNKQQVIEPDYQGDLNGRKRKTL